MKFTTIAVSLSLLLAGCASMEEAYYIDREFGQAQMASWDNQVVYPDYRYVDRIPEGTAGITAEEVMSVYNRTFAKEPQQVNIFQLDIAQ
jgi:hypothetical protein